MVICSNLIIYNYVFIYINIDIYIYTGLEIGGFVSSNANANFLDTANHF